MSFIRSLLFAGLALASVVPKHARSTGLLSFQKRDNGDCADGGPWVDPVYAGGYQDGTTIDFCETGWPSYGHPINQINVFSTTEAVRGIMFGYDDPAQTLSTQTYGTDSCQACSEQSLAINYEGGETISSITMYAPDGAMYLRGLTITTSAGQTLQSGVDASSGFPAYTQDVGTGILIGAAGGYQPGIIDQLGFLFLDSPIASIVVSDITVTGGPTGTQGITPMELDTQHNYNGDTTNESWSFMGNRQVMSQTAITSTTVDTYGGSQAFATKFDGGFPEIFKEGITSTTTFMWSEADTSTTVKTTTTSQTLTWSQSGTLTPGEGITCNSVSGTGSGVFPFTSMVTITLEDGTVYAQYKDTGSFSVQAVSSNSVSCVPDNTQ